MQGDRRGTLRIADSHTFFMPPRKLAGGGVQMVDGEVLKTYRAARLNSSCTVPNSWCRHRRKEDKSSLIFYQY